MSAIEHRYLPTKIRIHLIKSTFQFCQYVNDRVLCKGMPSTEKSSARVACVGTAQACLLSSSAHCSSKHQNLVLRNKESAIIIRVDRVVQGVNKIPHLCTLPLASVVGPKHSPDADRMHVMYASITRPRRQNLVAIEQRADLRS
jgi:hypothetical protein